MKTSDLQLHAYLDDELSSTERAAFETRLERDEALRSDLEAYQSLSAAFADLPAPETVPAAPVWNAVRREIRPEPQARPAMALKWTWAPLTAAAVVLGAVLLNPFSSSAVPPSVIVEQVEVQADATVPLVYTDQDSGWTVVWLSKTHPQEEHAPL